LNVGGTSSEKEATKPKGSPLHAVKRAGGVFYTASEKEATVAAADVGK
jgi:hypothetical protein